MDDSHAAVAEPIDIAINIRTAKRSEYRLVQARWNRRILRIAKVDAYDRGALEYVSLGRGPTDMRISQNVLALAQRMHADAVLADPSTRVLMATLPDLDEPMGFAVWTGDLLHYVDVLASARRSGVGRKLVQTVRAIHGGPMRATYVTRDGAKLLEYIR